MLHEQLDCLQLAEHYADRDSPALYHAAPGDFPHSSSGLLLVAFHAVVPLSCVLFGVVLHFSFALPTFDSDAAVPLPYVSFGVVLHFSFALPTFDSDAAVPPSYVSFGVVPHFSFAPPKSDSDAAVPLLYISFGVQSALSNVQQPRSGSSQSHPFAIFGYLLPHLSAKCHPAHYGCFQKYLTVVGYAIVYAQHAWSEIRHSVFHSNLSRNVAACEMCSVVHCHLGLDLFVLPVDDDMLLDSDGEQ